MKYCDRDEGLIKGYSWHESFDAIATALKSFLKQKIYTKYK